MRKEQDWELFCVLKGISKLLQYCSKHPLKMTFMRFCHTGVSNTISEQYISQRIMREIKIKKVKSTICAEIQGRRANLPGWSKSCETHGSPVTGWGRSSLQLWIKWSLYCEPRKQFLTIADRSGTQPRTTTWKRSKALGSHICFLDSGLALVQIDLWSS